MCLYKHRIVSKIYTVLYYNGLVLVLFFWIIYKIYLALQKKPVFVP